MKTCIICHKSKELDDFHLDNGYIRGRCKSCSRRKVRIAHFQDRGIDITWQQFEDQYNLQDGCCAICEIPVELDSHLKKFSAVLDHDHKTNEFRGILCNNCNRAIGLLKDSPDILEKAALYLREKGK